MEVLSDPQPLTEALGRVQLWLAREFSSPSIIAQTAVIAAAVCLGFLAAPYLQRWLRTWHRGVDSESRVGRHANAFVRRLTLTLFPLLHPVVTLVFLAPAVAVAEQAGWPHQGIRLTASLLAAWVLIRLTSGLIRQRFWAQTVTVIVWTIAALSIFGVLETSVAYLDRLNWTIGGLRISPVGIAAGIGWLVILLWLATWVARMVEERVLSRSGATPSLQVLASRLLKVVLVIAAVFIALGTMGIDLTAFAVFTGALGVGIGFGLQAIFNNFIAGLILLSEKSLKVGDFVDLERGHLAGTVRQINIRNTIITTPDSIDVAVPNSEFVNGRVTNWTMLDAHARIHVPFGVAYDSDLEQVRAAVCEAAQQVKFTLHDDSGRVPQLWLVNFAESRLEFELVVWLTSEGIHRPLGARAAYCWAIYLSLRKHGIDIPFPQRDLHVKTPMPLRVDLDDDSEPHGHPDAGILVAGEPADQPSRGPAGEPASPPAGDERRPETGARMRKDDAGSAA